MVKPWNLHYNILQENLLALNISDNWMYCNYISIQNISAIHSFTGFSCIIYDINSTGTDVFFKTWLYTPSSCSFLKEFAVIGCHTEVPLNIDRAPKQSSSGHRTISMQIKGHSLPRRHQSALIFSGVTPPSWLWEPKCRGRERKQSSVPLVKHVSLKWQVKILLRSDQI